jgi:hypothetical protein
MMDFLKDLRRGVIEIAFSNDPNQIRPHLRVLSLRALKILIGF